MDCNRLELCGEVAEVAGLRYTPAGIPILGFTLRHGSQQMEAGMARRVECEIPAVVVGTLAEQVQNLTAGSAVRAVGFLAKRSLNSKHIIFHINWLENVYKEDYHGT